MLKPIFKYETASQFIDSEKFEKYKESAINSLSLLEKRSGKGNDFLGWLDLPNTYDKEEFERVEKAAKKIRENSKALVVIGIGGSYLCARAAIEFIYGNMHNLKNDNNPKIFFAGNSISSDYHYELLEILKDMDFSINVISKSGTTTEPAIAFRLFKELLIEKYGEEEAKERIYVTTDKEKGTLLNFSKEAGYERFTIADDVGGRFSVLTSVGLLPIAVAGIDIKKLMEGAKEALKDTRTLDFDNNPALKYATVRNVFYNDNKAIEILVNYEPSITYFAEWYKQLFAESHGKEGKGIFPASLNFSTDLHSLGQFVQDGTRNMFETVITVKEPNKKVEIKEDEKNVDGLNFLAGKTMDFVNTQAFLGTYLAHTDGNTPNLVIEISKRDEFSLGYLFYFFEITCAIDGYMLDVNPFDQPGVEEYKKNMFALLAKPGYEDMKKELEKRL